MPRIFDNINQTLLPALQETLDVAYRADFCVGYFNLRGWRQIDDKIETWTGGEEYRCRLLIGMHRSPEEALETAFSFRAKGDRMDNRKAVQFKKKLAEEFRHQLMLGAPSNTDEAGLRRLAQQLREGKVVVKLFLRHTLHAKLYLLYRQDIATPTIGFLGSSNLTFSGLKGQGELNIDVTDPLAARELEQWFEDRWTDHWCVDISPELIQIIEDSWASEQLRPPYYIYLKMAYHLSHEARAGLTEFTIPKQFQDKLFDFQTAAVKIAARHLNQRGGVLIGDVVGLGKTIMATAVTKIFEEDFNLTSLILCPKNLVKMWESYVHEYDLRAKVLSVTRVQKDLSDLRPYRLVLIDESHNLRNREGKRYRAIQEYIHRNESLCILLSATPYNKTYLDLSSQLRLFLNEETDLGIRPERLLREMGEAEFSRQHQTAIRSLIAFEKSNYADDWRELMSLFMVRRTRSFIHHHYAITDEASGRRYLSFVDGTRAYFPSRIPKKVSFSIDEHNPHDQYARLYREAVVETINGLNLPRYGLGNYVLKKPKTPPNRRAQQIMADLSRGGRRLMGFSRTNLFKRLESSGHAFLLSVERHILRNYIFLHAIENNLALPIGPQDSDMLDTRFEDGDAEAADYRHANFADEDEEEAETNDQVSPDQNPSFSNFSETIFKRKRCFRARAAKVYERYATHFQRRFRWIRADLFQPSLAKDLRADAQALLTILQDAGVWQAGQDTKLQALKRLLTEQHQHQKVLIFSQFADTVAYLTRELQAQGIQAVAGVTGNDADPTALAWRFSPRSNGISAEVGEAELRVLIATDVLSEGQNLQDSAIVVNYDLPWAIIRLIQRIGRVDRIGQQASEILGYTFWPADGLERLIRLRERLRQRLRENAEVMGTDEAFFEDEASEQPLVDLYHEKAGILDDEPETEIDLVSYAYQIWKNATEANPSLKKTVQALPSSIYSTKTCPESKGLPAPAGALVFLKTTTGNSALAWLDQHGQSVTESQFTILRAAACNLNTPALERPEHHHELVRQGVEHIMTEHKTLGGQLGRPSGARFKTYERLKPYAESLQGTLFAHEAEPLLKALDQIYRYPLREAAKNSINRQLRSGISDNDLAELVLNLHDNESLCLVHQERELGEPEIICSMGLV